jgi:hypothetical protein
VERQTAGTTRGVEDGEKAIMPEQQDVSNANNERSTTRKPEQTFEEMNTIREGLSDLAYSNDKEDGKDEEEDQDRGLGKLSKDDKRGWVIGTISKMVPHRMESIWLTQMRLGKLTQPGCGDKADYFCERGMK